MNTRDLQAFVAVIESGSMVRAAERLHLTQPGLTRRVQSLETTLGAELLDRQSKPLKPTATGNEVYALARTVLSAVDDLLSVASADSEPAGELRIGMPPFLADVALEKPVDHLRSAFPQLTLRITAGWSLGLVQSVERAALDAAVVLMPSNFMPPDTLRATALAFQPTVIVAARSLGLPDTPVALSDLARYAWVLNQNGCGMRSALGRALEMAGLPFNVAVEAFGSDLQLSLVARGLGIGVATPDVLARSAHRDALQVIDAVDFRTGVEAWFLHGSLPGRLMRPVELLRGSLTTVLAESGLKTYGDKRASRL
ncbi:MAG: LysR family transcriptional regulator [Paraburkholderia sp.]|uniref:LysR family transcriptional regulator n=1 Tax=Burkholderiaceae TaxID=119060 RepID=UPI0010F4B370|nr:LysR family transcriptional regulator [Burkholderia sp. 4M9327F10]